MTMTVNPETVDLEKRVKAVFLELERVGNHAWQQGERAAKVDLQYGRAVVKAVTHSEMYLSEVAPGQPGYNRYMRELLVKAYAELETLHQVAFCMGYNATVGA